MLFWVEGKILEDIGFLNTGLPIKKRPIAEILKVDILHYFIRNIFDFWGTGVFFGKPCTLAIGRLLSETLYLYIHFSPPLQALTNQRNQRKAK